MYLFSLQILLLHLLAYSKQTKGSSGKYQYRSLPYSNLGKAINHSYLFNNQIRSIIDLFISKRFSKT